MTSVHLSRRSAMKKHMPRFFQYLILIIVTLIILVPIVILIFGSLKTRGEMYSRPYTIPNPPRWENYGRILGSSPAHMVATPRKKSVT